MFVWLKVNKTKDVMELATTKCISRGIFLIPGHAFNYDRSKPEQHLRLCYSYATPQEIDKVLLFFDSLFYLIHLIIYSIASMFFKRLVHMHVFTNSRSFIYFTYSYVKIILRRSFLFRRFQR